MKIPATMFMTMVIALASHTPTMAATCESLASLTLPNTTITLAVSVAAGAFVPPKPFAGPGSAPPPPPFSELPAFCRVAAEVRPVATSRIKFEVWMPSTGWNGKFAGVGHSPSPLGNPVLDNALAWVDCELHQEYDGGDHTIVVGAVRALGARPDAEPLLFYKGRYAGVGSRAGALESAA